MGGHSNPPSTAKSVNVATQSAYTPRYGSAPTMATSQPYNPKTPGALGDLIPTLTVDQCDAQIAAAEDTIKLTGKNYVVGFVVGGIVGAVLMKWLG